MSLPQGAIEALCRATAGVAQALLDWLGTPFARQGERLSHASGFVALVDLECTAFWPVIWLLASLAFFGVLARLPWHRLAAWSLAGVSVIVVLNQLRLVAVLWVGVHVPASFAWVHEALGPLALVIVGAALVAGAMRAGLPPSGGPTATMTLAALGISSMALAPDTAKGQGGPTANVALVSSRASATQDAPIVSGDLIVKFREASEPGRQLAAVLAGQRSVGSMAPLAVHLSADLGLPLVLVQVTSGREALLALDREALARSLLARAGRETAVQRAVMTVPPPAAGLPGAELVLRIEVRRGTTAAVRDGLAARLAIDALARPRPLPDGGAEALRLHYDIDALTLALIAAMQQRPDVEYAQANRLLRPALPPAAGASR